jgi:hypothetical protein
MTTIESRVLTLEYTTRFRFVPHSTSDTPTILVFTMPTGSSPGKGVKTLEELLNADYVNESYVFRCFALDDRT